MILSQRPAGAGEPRAWTLDGERVAIEVDPSVFPAEVVARAAYTLLDRAWFFLFHEGETLIVILRAKDPTEDLSQLIGDLGNALVDARVRADLTEATRGVHEQIVAEAFAPVRDRR